MFFDNLKQRRPSPYRYYKVISYLLTVTISLSNGQQIHASYRGLAPAGMIPATFTKHSDNTFNIQSFSIKLFYATFSYSRLNLSYRLFLTINCIRSYLDVSQDFIIISLSLCFLGLFFPLEASIVDPTRTSVYYVNYNSVPQTLTLEVSSSWFLNVATLT